MTINEIILAACTPVISNIWANELPPNPTWPAVMFKVDTVPENTWVQGGGYDQHTVTLYVMGMSLSDVKALDLQLKAVLEVLPTFIIEGESGDADYEDDPDVYAYFHEYTLRIRT